MPGLRLFPRGVLRRKEPQNDIVIRVSSEGREGDFDPTPPPRRRLTLRLPRWRTGRKLPEADSHGISSNGYLDAHSTFGGSSPSKTLCSVPGDTTGFKEPIKDGASPAEDSLLFASCEAGQVAVSRRASCHSRRSAYSMKPLPPLPEPATVSPPHPSLPAAALRSTSRSSSSSEAESAVPRPSSPDAIDSPITAHHIIQRLGGLPSLSSRSSSSCDSESQPDDQELKRSAYLKPGSTIRNKWETFTIDYLVNEGGFGVVYRAHSQAGETVAIKVMAKDWLATIVESLEWAKLEFEILRRVSEEGRRFMTELLSSWADAHNIYFVMRYYPATLKTLMRTVDKAHLPFSLYAAELVNAVTELHEMGFIHLDIKPDNILITPNGHLSLADFGLAYHLTPEEPVCKKQCGTPCYEAPEVLAENLFGTPGCDQRADVWSLGIVFLQMFMHDLTPPHQRQGDTVADELLRTLAWDPRTLWGMQYLETHVPELHHLLCQMLQRDPRLRIDTKGIKDHPYFKGIDWQKLGDAPSTLRLKPQENKNLDTTISDDRYQPKRQDSKSIDYDFSYRCPPKLKALGDARHGAL